MSRTFAGLLVGLTRSVNGLQHIQTRNLRLYREKTVRLMYWRGRSYDAVKFSQRRRDELQEWNYRSEIFAFSRRLQENLSENTLRRVLAHPSYVDSVKRSQAKLSLPDPNLESNEGMVVRGEQLLDQCLKPYLRHVYPRVPEDGIQSTVDYLKSDQVMADIAQWIGCKDIVLTSEWPPATATLANTVRALLAGIEADLGLARVQRFIVDMIVSYLNDKDILDDVWQIPNPKETLNLLLNNSQLPPYEPRIMFQTGVRTLESCHLVGLYVNQRLLGSSAGETLPIAEECAALNALQRLFDLGDQRQPLVYGEASEQIDYASHTREHEPIKTWRFKLE